MKEYIFENGIKLIYKETTSELSSIAIALDAGAGRDGDILGVAHVTEHMVYKGTETRSEKEINTELSSIFGFQNAMTNYPYVVYYGTLLNEDLKDGVEFFADILINPIFNEEGFNEEISVIKEELNEWDEEVEQFCEDKLFLNAFANRRLKYPIIGNIESLQVMTLDNIKEFYSKHYFPGNTSIAVTSSLTFEEVVLIIEETFASWSKVSNIDKNIKYEKPKQDIFTDKRESINTCKVQIIAPIHELNNDEIKALKVFNQYFGEGVNSILFDTLRTKNGLVYDVLTRVANEEFIKIYKITYSTSSENVEKTVELVKDIINNLEILKDSFDESLKLKLIKSFKLKRLFGEEQSVRLVMSLATYDSMFGDYNLYLDETKDLKDISIDYLFNVAKNVLSHVSIEIIKS